jgi:histidinol-phosphate aminotransferase
VSLPFPINPSLKDLQPYQPGRPIEEVARELGLPPESIIKLASNENPLGPSPAALQAMRRVLDSIHLYPDGNAYYLKHKLAAKLQLKPENLILGNGSSEIIEFVGHTLLGPGAEVVVSQYSFIVYPMVTRLFDAKLVTVPATDYGHNIRAMLDAVTPRTRVMFAGNPNNPTGTCAPNEELTKLVANIPDHVLLVMDEAYVDFMQNPPDLLGTIQRGSKPNLLILRTFSKIFGLAGLRIGYGIGHPDLIAAMEKVRQPFNLNSIAQAGALAALEDSEHLQKTRANNLAGLAFFEEAFRKQKLEFVRSQANFILVRVGEGQNVFDQLQRQGVIVRPMGAYQLPDWVRITVGTPEENRRCVTALVNFLGARP